MAYEIVKSLAGLLLLLNFSIYVVVSAIAGWALNKAIDEKVATGPGGVLPGDFSAIYVPIGNAATGFFLIFALIAGVVGAASALSALVQHLRVWTAESVASAVSSAFIAWALSVLATGLASKEIHLRGRDRKLIALELLVIIVSGTQLLYILLSRSGFGGENIGATVTRAEPLKESVSEASPAVV